MIYFVRCDLTGLTKIGFTSRGMKERMAALQCGSPTVLRVVGAREGEYLDEAAAHAFYQEKRRHGEWFLLSDADIEREHLRPAAEVEATEAGSPRPSRAVKQWDPAQRLRESAEYAARAAARGIARQP